MFPKIRRTIDNNQRGLLQTIGIRILTELSPGHGAVAHCRKTDGNLVGRAKTSVRGKDVCRPLQRVPQQGLQGGLALLQGLLQP